MFQIKIERFTPREILFFYLTHENKQPKEVVCAVMWIKKSMYYNIKQLVEEEVEKQYKRYIIANYKK